jgi:hypothetical protein
MTTANALRNSLLLLGALLAGSAQADVPRQLMWEDLVPKPSAAENPFAKLTKDQLLALSDIASVRDRKARGDKTLSEIDLTDERAATRRLEQAGIDVDGLLARRKEIAEQKRSRTLAVNASLDGQTVRLPGYLLPLEFSGKQVTEFLLVPWVGACIHTPPPPPNQIVHVKSARPFEMAGIFMPVWVTGQMSTGATKKSLFLIDGSSDIDVGYSMRATEVEPYKE